jgi:hypothetical protein
MKIAPSAGFLYVTFEPEDWVNPSGGARSVISGIKTSIGVLRDGNPDGFTYDPDTHAWDFRDTPKNRSIIERLKEEYLPKDPRQSSLF